MAPYVRIYKGIEPVQQTRDTTSEPFAQAQGTSERRELGTDFKVCDGRIVDLGAFCQLALA